MSAHLPTLENHDTRPFSLKDETAIVFSNAAGNSTALEFSSLPIAATSVHPRSCASLIASSKAALNTVDPRLMLMILALTPSSAEPSLLNPAAYLIALARTLFPPSSSL